jgi:hypothetical protein
MKKTNRIILQAAPIHQRQHLTEQAIDAFTAIRADPSNRVDAVFLAKVEDIVADLEDFSFKMLTGEIKIKRPQGRIAQKPIYQRDRGEYVESNADQIADGQRWIMNEQRATLIASQPKRRLLAVAVR